MASLAPGQDSARDDHECYNCGAKGHVTFACPEETRKVPAGLAAYKRRQASAQSNQSSSNGSQSRHSNGMVVTRYPPPPGTGPQITHYSQPAPPPGVAAPGLFPPGPPPPVPQPYHPQQQGQWQHPQPAYGAPYPGPPAPPPYGPNVGQFPPPPVMMPPPGPNPYPPQYPQPQYPQPQYPQPQYSQPYGQPGYGYYPPGPHGPPGPPGPPAPLAPPSYPPTPSGSNLGPRLPHGSSLPPVPTPTGYQPPPFGPAPGFPHHPPPAPPPQPMLPSRPPFPPADDWNQQPSRGRGNWNQPANRGRDRWNRRRGDRGSGQESQVARPAPHERASLPKSESLRTTPDSSATASPAEAPCIPQHAPNAEEADDFEWEMEQLFKETKTKAADPVGVPLPSEWNDDPTIPPAFDAKSIKSKFFAVDDEATFGKTIRDTAYWEELKFDPSFKLRQGMVRRVFANDKHEYPTYNFKLGDENRRLIDSAVDSSTTPPSPHEILDAPDSMDRWSPRMNRATVHSGRSRQMPRRSTEAKEYPLPPRPPTEVDMSYASRDRQEYRNASGTLGKRGRDGSPAPNDGYSKRPRPSGQSSPTNPRSSYPPAEDYAPRGFNKQAISNEARGRARQHSYSSSAPPADFHNGRANPRSDKRFSDGYGDDVRGPPAASAPRHDSGYQSGRSNERAQASKGRPSPRDQATPQRRRRSESRDDRRSRSQTPGRREARSQSPSQASSGSGPAGRKRSPSPLCDLEFELLGMIPPEEDEKKKASASGQSGKKPRTKVAAVFSRRW